MEWMLLVCWLETNLIKCDPIMLKDTYSDCIKEMQVRISKDRNIFAWCRPAPTDKDDYNQ